MRIVFSEEADSDLLQLLSYRAARNRVAAVVLANLFNTKIESLIHFTFLGRDRSALANGLRSIVADAYIVFYRVERERIFIVRVLDGRRDIDAEFEP